MPPNTDTPEQTAIAVVASHGLGRGIATAFAEAGVPVIAVARSAAALAELASGAGDIQTEVADATDQDSLYSLLDQYEPRTVLLVATPRSRPPSTTPPARPSSTASTRRLRRRRRRRRGRPDGAGATPRPTGAASTTRRRHKHLARPPQSQRGAGVLADDGARAIRTPPRYDGHCVGSRQRVLLIAAGAKAARTRSAQPVSLGFLAKYRRGYVAWALYGMAIGSTPLIVVDLIGICTSSMTVGVVLRLRHATDEPLISLGRE